MTSLSPLVPLEQVIVLPLFPMFHVYLDALFEKWMRRHGHEAACDGVRLSDAALQPESFASREANLDDCIDRSRAGATRSAAPRLAPTSLVVPTVGTALRLRLCWPRGREATHRPLGRQRVTAEPLVSAPHPGASVAMHFGLSYRMMCQSQKDLFGAVYDFELE